MPELNRKFSLLNPERISNNIQPKGNAKIQTLPHNVPPIHDVRCVVGSACGVPDQTGNGDSPKTSARLELQVQGFFSLTIGTGLMAGNFFVRLIHHCKTASG